MRCYALDCVKCGKHFYFRGMRKFCRECKPVRRRRAPLSYLPNDIRGGVAEHSDCSVMAICAAANIAYKDAHVVMELAGRKCGGGANMSQGMAVLASLGLASVEFIRLVSSKYCYSDEKGLFQWEDVRTFAPTLGRLLKKIPAGRYIAVKSGHAFAIIDGVVQDNRGQGYNTKIFALWKVEPI